MSQQKVPYSCTLMENVLNFLIYPVDHLLQTDFVYNLHPGRGGSSV